MGKKKGKKKISPRQMVIDHLEQEIEMLEEEAHVAEKCAGELKRAVEILIGQEEERKERGEDDENEEEEEETE